MKSKLKLIKFTIDLNSDENIIGFKVLSSNEAKQYLKTIKLLENNESEFIINNINYKYSSDYFECDSISNKDLDVLSKYFDLDIDNEDSNKIGIFPNALEDAYEEGLIEDQQNNNDDDYSDQQDEEYI